MTIKDQRRGYDSYELDEALRQAEQRGENTSLDRLMGVPGSGGEIVRLALILGAIAWLVAAVGYGLANFVRLPLGLPIAILVSIASSVASVFAAKWFSRPFAGQRARRLVWGFSAAASFLILVRIVLALTLLAKFRIEGMGAEEAGVRSFHGAAWFTLMIAMPSWVLWVVWGWLRRGHGSTGAAAPLWRRILPLLFIAAVMIFMAGEGAYMDGLK